MSREDYDKALRMGRRAFQEARNEGESPYLRVLEEDTAGIDVVYTQALPDGTKHLVELLKRAIIDGTLLPFAGVIHDQDGDIIVPEGSVLGTEEIITMDWLVENVVGNIPGIEEVTDEAAAAMNPARI